MSDKERLAYAITLDTAQLEASSKRASDAFRGMGNNIDSESDRISNSMKKIGGAAAAYFTVTSLNNFAQSVIRVRGEIEALEISFETLLGSKDKAKELNERIFEFFKIYYRHRDKISRINLWGISDANSWLNGWPVPGRTNYPLLFDRDYKAKPVVEDIIKLYSK